MDKGKQVILLIGSPKPDGGTSGSIGNYLGDILTQASLQVNIMHIRSQLKSAEGRSALIEGLDQSDWIVLIAPLYVDSLPAPVIRAMELIAANRCESSKERRLIAIVNAGFPEASQNETALAVCQNFALEAGLKWGGGMPIGMGGMISGKPLSQMGGMVRNLTSALDLLAGAIIEDKKLSEEAVSLAAVPFMPTWGYRLMGNIGWKVQARKNGVSWRINSRP